MASDDEDLTVCIICQEDFDCQNNLPKLLSCHHCICLSCIKVFRGAIICPYKCKILTKLDGKSAEDLMTNFYIFPMVEKKTNSRKNIESLHSQAVSNRVEAITLRRQVLEPKLNTVSEAIRFFEKLLSEETEENNNQITKLRSLLKELNGFQFPHSHLPPLAKCQSNLNDSIIDLTAAKSLSDELVDLEDIFSQITLTNSRDGKQYRVKGTEEEPSTRTSASVTLLNYALHQLKVADRLEEVTLVDKQQQIDTERLEVEPVTKRVTRPLPVSKFPRSKKAFLFFNVDGIVKPIVVIKLLVDDAPLMCEAFIKLCLGREHFSYEGSGVYPEKSGRRLTGGNFNELSLTSEDESGKYDRTTEHSRRFLADKSKVAERKGSVRMRNRNQQRDSESTGVWVCSEFSIACSDDFGGAPHRLTTVFGYICKGMDVCEQISRLDSTRHEIFIDSCGLWPIGANQK